MRLAFLGPPRSRWRILALYLGLAVVATAPGSLLTGFRTVGSPYGDLQQHLWSLWWNVEAPVFRLQSPLHTTLLNFPEGGDLYPVDLTGVLLTLPLQLLLPGRLVPTVAVAHNLRVLFELVLAGWGAFLLASLYTRRKAPAVAAGALYAFTPYMLGSLENGVTELLGIGWIPLALWGLERAWRIPDRRRSVEAGVLLGVALLANWYYAAAMALLVPLWCAWRLLDPPAPRARGLAAVATAGLVALLMAAPAAKMFQDYLHSPRALSSHPVGGRTVRDIAPADLAAMVLAGKDPPRPEWPYHHTAWLGYGAVLLALGGVGRRGAFWLPVAALFTGLSLGPAVTWRLQGLPLEGLPFQRLAEALPALGTMNFPYRLVVVATLALSMLGGLALARLPRRLQARGAALVVALVLAEGWLVSPAPWPVSTTEARIPTAVHAMSLGSRNFAVMPLPAFARTLPRGDRSEGDHNRLLYKYTWGRYSYQATVHGGALPYGVQDRFPDFLHGNVLTGWLFSDQAAPPGTTLQQGARALASQGYRWLVLDGTMLPAPDPYSGPLQEALGPPAAPGPVRAWRLIPPAGIPRPGRP